MKKEIVKKKDYGVWNKDRLQDVLDYLKGQNTNLSQQEFITFIEIGRLTGLNPFLREIWAVKYGDKSANIFIGRDGYRKSAQRHVEYEHHTVDAVYDNDEFEFVDGKVKHKYNLKDRGELVGAYCIVKRKSATLPAFNYVEYKEYKQPFGVWIQKPATMIKKVAEAQGLRGAFQELFAGTYEESENWEAEKPVVKVVKKKT
jgi:phage recombination protein Bet